ncbi:hypothetical protein H311_00336 [Anncaliia algerae PRA109]|nr:hypothetical protein H311_00336 [Anncaliia algerae PRA109]
MISFYLFFLPKILQALDIKTEFRISILTALNLIHKAWNLVLETTIINTFIHSRLIVDYVNQASNQTNNTKIYSLFKIQPSELFHSERDFENFVREMTF